MPVVIGSKNVLHPEKRLDCIWILKRDWTRIRRSTAQATVTGRRARRTSQVDTLALNSVTLNLSLLFGACGGVCLCHLLCMFLLSPEYWAPARDQRLVHELSVRCLRPPWNRESKREEGMESIMVLLKLKDLKLKLKHLKSSLISCEDFMCARLLDPSVLTLVSHNTDTPNYAFPFPLALSLIIKTKSHSSCHHQTKI